MGQSMSQKKMKYKRFQIDADYLSNLSNLSSNGFKMCDKYIPEEIISQLFINYVDYKTLLSCQAVCISWNYLIKNYIWRKKSELIVDQPSNLIKDLSWKVYYQLCHKTPFGKNLIQNHSGKYHLDDWLIICNGNMDWTVEQLPVHVAELPKNDQLNDMQHCFVSSSDNSVKRQIIYLESVGLLPEYLDNYQPLITIGEWYMSSSGAEATYRLIVRLIDKKNKDLDCFDFKRTIYPQENSWQHVSHEFKNYGQGLRKIIFQHEGRGRYIWTERGGCKMAGASITINIPEHEKKLRHNFFN